MIRERKARIDIFRRLEEESVLKKCEVDEIRRRLKSKYQRREGLMTEIEQAKRSAKKASKRSLRRFVNSIAGNADRDFAKQSIRRNYALDSLEKMNRDIEIMEKRAVLCIRERAEIRSKLSKEKSDIDGDIREVKNYVRSLRPNKKNAVQDYLDTDRKRILLEQVCTSGNLYYRKLKELSSRVSGASRMAKNPLGKNPRWEILLQEAYFSQGNRMSQDAETLQLDFVIKLNTLEIMNHTHYRTGGKIAFSPFLFDTTLTQLLAKRQGDRLKKLLEKGLNETAELLLQLEKEKAEAIRCWQVAVDESGMPV